MLIYLNDDRPKTLIIERFPFFGGTATASLMLNINGFRNQVKPDGLQTSRCIPEEVILLLKEIDVEMLRNQLIKQGAEIGQNNKS
jgi:hypothetical protein